VIVVGEVNAMLVFDLVDVAKAPAQLKRLSVASSEVDVQSVRVAEAGGVLLAHVLRLLLGSFFLKGGG
jgi:hypothetical protein